MLLVIKERKSMILLCVHDIHNFADPKSHVLEMISAVLFPAKTIVEFNVHFFSRQKIMRRFNVPPLFPPTLSPPLPRREMDGWTIKG